MKNYTPARKARNRSLTCNCSGWWFPHRRGSQPSADLAARVGKAGCLFAAVLILAGCATCARHPVVCAVGTAVALGAVDLSISPGHTVRLEARIPVRH